MCAGLYGHPVYLLMTPLFSIFTLAIKFDCLFLSIFQSFYLFVSSIFDKLTPPPPLHICFKKYFKSLFSPLQCIKLFVESKNVVFFSFCILVDMPEMGGGYSPPLTTLLSLSHNKFFFRKFLVTSLHVICAPHFRLVSLRFVCPGDGTGVMAIAF